MSNFAANLPNTQTALSAISLAFDFVFPVVPLLLAVAFDAAAECGDELIKQFDFQTKITFGGSSWQAQNGKKTSRSSSIWQTNGSVKSAGARPAAYRSTTTKAKM